MPYLKILSSSALVLGLAAILFAGPASAASGTTLCKANETPCSSSNHYAAGTKFKAVSGPMTLTKTFEKSKEVVECSHADIAGKTSSTGGSGANVEAVIEELHFYECTACANVWLMTAGSPSPKTAFANTPGTMNGTMTMSGTEGEEPAIATWCGTGECVFKSTSITLDVTGGESATLVAKEENLKKTSGVICPQSIDWSATYTFAEPSPLYLAQSP